MPIGGGKGEVMFDNRADGKGIQEFWTLTCAHCNRVQYVNPATGNVLHLRYVKQMPENIVVEITYWEASPPEVCRKCMAYLCDNKACHADCLPVKAGIEAILGKEEEGVEPFNTDEEHRVILKSVYEKMHVYPGISLPF